MVRDTLANLAELLLPEQAHLIQAQDLTVQQVVDDTREDGVDVHDYVVALLNRAYDVDFAIYQRADQDRSQLIQVEGALAPTQPPVANVRLLFDRNGEHYESLRFSQAENPAAPSSAPAEESFRSTASSPMKEPVAGDINSDIDG